LGRAIFLHNGTRNWPNELANWFDALLAVAGMVDFFLTLSLPAEASTSQSAWGYGKKKLLKHFLIFFFGTEMGRGSERKEKQR